MLNNTQVSLSSSREKSLMFLKKWGVWILASLFYFYEMVLRASPSVMATDLMEHFKVSSTTLGLLGSTYYYAYVALQIPCGVIVDKWGTRLVITVSTLLCVGGSLIFATTSDLYVAQIGRLLVGAGSACAFLCCLKIGAEWFLPTQFALIAGMTNMMGTLGGMVSGPPFAFLMNITGWQQATLITAFLGLILAGASWVFIKDKPSSSLATSPANHNVLESLWCVIKMPQNWIIGIVGGLLYIPVTAFCELWAVPFLMKKYSIPNSEAALASVMVYLGIAAGSPLNAKLSAHWKSRKKVMISSAFLTGSLFLGVLYIPHLSFLLLLCILFIAGMVNSGQVLCFSAIKETLPHHLSGTAVGFTNTLVMMSGVIFQPLLGIILDYGWTGEVSASGIRIYDLDAYHGAILALPLCLYLGGMALFLTKETYPKNDPPS